MNDNELWERLEKRFNLKVRNRIMEWDAKEIDYDECPRMVRDICCEGRRGCFKESCGKCAERLSRGWLKWNNYLQERERIIAIIKSNMIDDKINDGWKLIYDIENGIDTRKDYDFVTNKETQKINQ